MEQAVKATKESMEQSQQLGKGQVYETDAQLDGTGLDGQGPDQGHAAQHPEGQDGLLASVEGASLDKDKIICYMTVT